MSVTPSPEQMRAAAAYVTTIYEVLTGTGKHAEHQREQIGRCVFCSCGTRVQGQLSSCDAVAHDNPT